MRHSTAVALATLGFMAGAVILSIPRWRRGWLGWLALGAYFLTLSALAGCGGGDYLTPEESAQHDADVAALAALPADRKTIQPIPCAPACVK